MKQTSPALVAQNAVRRLPRAALIILSLAYVLPGFLGRAPWKAFDIEAFGFMLQLAQPDAAAAVSWLHPTLLGQADPNLALLPTWLGAWFIPMVIAVVGLHFLPLARLFRYPPHQLTGGALIALAILAPLASGRPDNAWGPLGTGLILWASAAWALSPRAMAGPARPAR